MVEDNQTSNISLEPQVKAWAQTASKVNTNGTIGMLCNFVTDVDSKDLLLVSASVSNSYCVWKISSHSAISVGF